MGQYDRSPVHEGFRSHSDNESTTGAPIERIGFSELFETTWAQYKGRFKDLLALGAITFVAYFVASVLCFLCVWIPLGFIWFGTAAVATQRTAPEFSFGEARTAPAIQGEFREFTEPASEAPVFSEENPAESTGDTTWETTGEQEEQSDVPAALQEAMRNVAVKKPASPGFAPIFLLMAIVLVCCVFFALVFSLVYLWLVAGQIRYLLELVTGGNPSIGRMFSGWKYLGRYVYYCAYVTIIVMLLFVPIFLATCYPGVSLIASAHAEPGPGVPSGFWLGVFLIGLGLFVFGLVAFYVQLIYSFGIYFIVDRDAAVSSAMRRSRRCVHRNFPTIFCATIVLTFLFAVAGGCVPFAGILTTPFFMLFFVIAYLKMTGRHDAIVTPATRMD